MLADSTVVGRVDTLKPGMPPSGGFRFRLVEQPADAADRLPGPAT